jgi:hypothetical protein
MLEVFAGRDRTEKVARARELVERVYGEASVGAVYRDRIEAVRAQRDIAMDTARAAA